jgi:hypothetical protein
MVGAGTRVAQAQVVRVVCRYQWFFRAMGRKRAAGAASGRDMANRCSDAMLYFVLQSVPLPRAVQHNLACSLATRWGPSMMDACSADALSDRLASFFQLQRAALPDGNAGRPLDDDLIGPGPGCDVVKHFRP